MPEEKWEKAPAYAIKPRREDENYDVYRYTKLNIHKKSIDKIVKNYVKI